MSFAKNATVRFLSCSLGANYRWDKTGENFMKNFGEKLLNNGGEVIASNYTVFATDHFPKSAHKGPVKKWYENYFDLAVTETLTLPILGAMDALETNDGPYRKVKIEQHP